MRYDLRKLDALRKKLQRTEEEDLLLARFDLIRAAIPDGPVRCRCGGPFIRKNDPWCTSFDLRKRARDVQSSAAMDLAMHDLCDEGIMTQRRPDLRVRLNLAHPEVRRVRDQLRRRAARARDASSAVESTGG